MKRVVVFPQDQSGCYWHRLRYPIDVLRRDDWNIDIIEINQPERHPRILIDRQPGRFPQMRAFEVPEADVVVLARPMRWEHWACIPFIQAQGVRVVVELDDDFENLQPSHAAWRAVQPKFNWACNKEHLKEVIRRADALVVSTPALADVYGPLTDEVHVVANYIPAWFTEIDKPDNEIPIVGWSGTVASHPNDLKQMGNAVSRLVREGVVQMSLVGDDIRVKGHLGLNTMHSWGWVSADVYPHAMATFDIGIVPLELAPFNNAKSALKVLTNAAVGTPSIASPTEPNKALLDDGICTIAETQRDWYEAIRFLAERPHIRQDIGERCRATVIEKYTMEDNAWRFGQAWTGEK